MGIEVEHFYRDEANFYYERLDEIMEPTTGDILAYNRATKLYERYERWGMPREGHWSQQDASWLHVIECVMTARNRAEAENRRAEAHARKIEAEAREASS